MIFTSHKSNFPLLQDQKLERSLALKQDLFRVGYLYVDDLCKPHKGLLCQTLEESQVVEDLLVRLLQELAPQIRGQTRNELPVRFEAELLLDRVGLADVVADLGVQIVTDAVLFGQSARSLQVLLLGFVLLGDVTQQSAHLVDDVGEHYAAEALDY